MGNATWWKADDYDEPDGKCLVSKPDPKNKDGKPIMVWVDCDWKSGRLVTHRHHLPCLSSFHLFAGCLGDSSNNNDD